MNCFLERHARYRRDDPEVPGTIPPRLTGALRRHAFMNKFPTRLFSGMTQQPETEKSSESIDLT
jgi:hypothetical protein